MGLAFTETGSLWWFCFQSEHTWPPPLQVRVMWSSKKLADEATEAEPWWVCLGGLVLQAGSRANCSANSLKTSKARLEI